MEVLKDKAYRRYDYISRYTGFPYYYNAVDNKYIYGTTGQIVKDIPYVLHIAQQRDTFDTLALKYYGNPTLYWVICDFNDIQDPYTDIEVGQKIKIPSLSSISFE